MDAGFGGSIVDLAILARLAVDGADIDHPAEFAFDHPVPGRLAHVVAAAQIGIDHLVPGGAAHFLHGAVASDAGIVDDHVHRTQIALDLLHARDAIVEGGDIPFVGLDPRAVSYTH